MTTTAAFIAFTFLAILTVAAGFAAVALRNLVHCGLSLALTYIGMGGLFLLLGAEFVGFAQLLVSVGAVAVLIMFVILLTPTTKSESLPSLRAFGSVLPGLAISAGVFGVLLVAITGSVSISNEAPPAPAVTVESLGVALVSSHVLPLQITGVLLTTALIGGVIFALKEEEK